MNVNVYIIDNTNIRRNNIDAILETLSEEIHSASFYDAMENVYMEQSVDTVRDCDEKCHECNINVQYVNLKEPFVLFIHTSNKCFYTFMKQLADKNEKCWVACYSGGESARWHDTLRRQNEEFNVNFSSRIKLNADKAHINSKWNIKAFIEAVVQSQPNPFEFLERKGTPHLIALSILCQGYLVAHWKEIDNGKEETLSGLNTWNSLSPEVKKKVQDNKNKTKGQGWWEPACNKDDLEKGDLKDTSLGKELTSLGKACEDSSAIKALFDEIKESNDQSFCGTDKVIAAYNYIKEIL